MNYSDINLSDKKFIEKLQNEAFSEGLELGLFIGVPTTFMLAALGFAIGKLMYWI